MLAHPKPVSYFRRGEIPDDLHKTIHRAHCPDVRPCLRFGRFPKRWRLTWRRFVCLSNRGSQVRDSFAAGSTNRLDKVKQTNAEDTANKVPGKKAEMSMAGSPSASSNTANGPATSQPSVMAEKKEESPGSPAGTGGIEPISDEQAVAELRRAGISTSGMGHKL